MKAILLFTLLFLVTSESVIIEVTKVPDSLFTRERSGGVQMGLLPSIWLWYCTNGCPDMSIVSSPLQVINPEYINMGCGMNDINSPLISHEIG